MRKQRSQQWEKNITKWVHLFGLTNKATWPKSLTSGGKVNYHTSLREQPFLHAPNRRGRFRKEERLRLSDRNSILMTYINIYMINLVVVGFQMQICSILRFFWSILVKFVFVCERTPAKVKCFF